MPARVPQDVDLEDNLLYGLSPLRFGYLVVAVLATLSLWRLTAVPLAARLPGCLALGGGGAVLAWGRWRGRAADRWLADGLVFLRRNYRLGLADRRARRAPASRRAVVVPFRSIGALSAGRGAAPATGPEVPPPA